MEKCFFNAASLASVPELPDKLTNLNSTFSGCTSLIKVEGAIVETAVLIFHTGRMYCLRQRQRLVRGR